jgi:MFS family permease
MIIVYAVIAFAITFFMLRKSGGVVRHLIAFVVAALVVIVLTTVTFELFYPEYGIDVSYTARYNAQMVYTLIGTAAAVLGPMAGMLAAKFSRKKRAKAIAA